MVNRRDAIGAVDFVRVYGPLAKQGKSALEIGQALGMTGDAKKIAIAVSVKASQLRKRLVESAQAKAKADNLSDEDTAKLVETMGAKLPKIKGATRGRKADVSAIVAALDEVLSALDAPAEPNTETPAEPTPETPAEPNTEAPVEPEAKPRRRRGLLG